MLPQFNSMEIPEALGRAIGIYPCATASYYDLTSHLIEDPWSRQPLQRVCSAMRRLGVQAVVIENDIQFDRQFVESHAIVAQDVIELNEHEPGSVLGVTRLTFYLEPPSQWKHDLDVVAVCVVIRRRAASNSTSTASWKSYLAEAVVAYPSYHPNNGSPVRLDAPNHYYHVGGPITVPRPGGTPTAIYGAWFCQSNGATSICAHAALRMVQFHVNAGNLLPVREVNELVSQWRAGRESDPKPFSDGLHISELHALCKQMADILPMDCVNSNGQDPPPWTAFEYAYSLIESGIPTLVAVSGGDQAAADHVFVVLGHTFDADDWSTIAIEQFDEEAAEKRAFVPSSKFIPRLIVHDDNLGPYLTLPNDSGAANGARRITHVIGVVPHKLTLPAPPVLVQEIGSDVFWSRWADEVASVHERWRMRFEREPLTPARLVLRTILLKREEYVAHLQNLTDHKQLHVVLTDEDWAVLTASLPQWVWMVEFSTTYLYSSSSGKLGEMLFDLDQIKSVPEPHELDEHGEPKLPVPLIFRTVNRLVLTGDRTFDIGIERSTRIYERQGVAPNQRSNRPRGGSGGQSTHLLRLADMRKQVGGATRGVVSAQSPLDYSTRLFVAGRGRHTEPSKTFKAHPREPRRARSSEPPSAPSEQHLAVAPIAAEARTSQNLTRDSRGLAKDDGTLASSETSRQLHLDAQLPAQLIVDVPVVLQVRVACELQQPRPGTVSQRTLFDGSGSEQLAITVVCRDGAVLIGASQHVISMPIPGQPCSAHFMVQGILVGEASIDVIVSSLPQHVNVATITLAPCVVEAGSEASSDTCSERAERPVPSITCYADNQLTIFQTGRLEASGQTVAFSFQLNIAAEGRTIPVRSTPFPGNMETYISEVFRDLEGCLRSPDSASRERDLRILGVDMMEKLVPRDIRECLWKHRSSIRSIMVQSDEPFIPWELLCLDDPASEMLSKDAIFLADLGLSRWLVTSKWPPTSLRIRPGKAHHLVPRYKVPDYALPAADAEIGMLCNVLGSVSIAQDTAAVLGVLKQNGALDVFHFSGHGNADHKASDILIDIDWADPSQQSYERKVLTDYQVRRLADVGRQSINRAIVILNACRTGRSRADLGTMGGFASAFLAAGAGVFIGAQWKVGDEAALRFTRTLYEEWKKPGTFLSDAVRSARGNANTPADRISWLSYAVYGHPNAILVVD